MNICHLNIYKIIISNSYLTRIDPYKSHTLYWLSLLCLFHMSASFARVNGYRLWQCHGLEIMTKYESNETTKLPLVYMLNHFSSLHVTFSHPCIFPLPQIKLSVYAICTTIVYFKYYIYIKMCLYASWQYRHRTKSNYVLYYIFVARGRHWHFWY